MKTLAALLLACPAAFAQTPPAIEWQSALGGSAWDQGWSMEQTGDGGYIIAGQSASNDGNVSGNHGNHDFWVVKLASDGAIQWQRSLGGAGVEDAHSIHQTSDLGYIIAGGADSNDGDVSGNHGNSDCWVVKLDADGTIQWQRSLGGSNSDVAFGILQTPDNGYIMAGETRSNDGDVTGNHGFKDIWVVRLDASGSLVWQHAYGGTGDEFSRAVVEAGDGGFVVAGATHSSDGDVTSNHGGIDDYWLLKLNGSGQLQWQRTYGGSADDEIHGLLRTSNGDFVVAGGSNSNDGDITIARGGSDIWVVRVDGNGTMQWQKTIGSSANDYGESIIEAADSDLIISGEVSANDNDVTMNHGGYDAWVVRINSIGSLLWEKCMGGTATDAAGDVVLTTDGGFAIAGVTSSNDGDVSGNHGGNDLWVVKLGPDQTAVSEVDAPPDALSLWPNPSSNELHISFATRMRAEVDIEIFDNTGRSISSYSERPSGIERSLVVPTAQLAPGSYCIRVVADGMATSRSFVKW